MSSFSVSSSYTKLRSIVEAASSEALPSPQAITSATDAIVSILPEGGLGEEATEAHLLNDLTPGFNGQKTSANYYGFVTGGVLPIAEAADNIVTAFDQNVMVHLPDQSISTTVEHRALAMLIELLELGEGWEGRLFTTGATGSNIMGLACGREAVLSQRLREVGEQGDAGVGELGLLTACLKAGVKEIQVLTTVGHSSLYKAASIVGIGRASVKDIPLSKTEPWKMDLSRLETELRRSSEGILSVVALSAGEINTGRFAMNGIEFMKKVRGLCDQYGAWLHVDGAFGLFARALPSTPEFDSLRAQTAGLELADSITGDGHKMLNVKVQTKADPSRTTQALRLRLFLTKQASTLYSIFQNPNAAYLSSSSASTVLSPLNHGPENSRRFRALPVYAVLLAYGRSGFADVFARQVRLARALAKWIDSDERLELLPKGEHGNNENQGTHEDTHITVIFRAKDEKVNDTLVASINKTRRVYVSGTAWEGKKACRFAISTWKVDVERDLKVVKEVLEGILDEAS